MRKSTIIRVIFVTMFVFFAMNALVMAQIYYDSSGNVGIGDTGPDARLEIVKPSSGDVLNLSSAASNDGDLVTIDNSGNVGIGITNPVRKLHVESSDSTWASLIYNNNSLSSGHGLTVKTNNTSSDNYMFGVYNVPASEYRFVVKGNGNVGIGIRNPVRKLHVISSDSTWASLIYNNNSNSSGHGLLVETNNTSSNNYMFGVYNMAASEYRFVVKGNGNVGIGMVSPNYELHVDGDIAYTGSIYDVSDIRLKENITPLEDAVEKVSAINGIYFNNIGEPENREIGVIAQEVETVLPEVVSEDDDGYKSVDYSKITPLLIEAVKELKAENEALKARISTLEATIQP